MTKTFASLLSMLKTRMRLNPLPRAWLKWINYIEKDKLVDKFKVQSKEFDKKHNDLNTQLQNMVCV